MTSSITSVPVIHLGCGGVGRAFVQQVLESRTHHGKRHGLRLALAALADSRAAVLANIAGLGMSDDALRACMDLKSAGGSLADRPDALAAQRGPWWLERVPGPGIVVDNTADPDLAPALIATLEAGWHVALANKIPLVGAMADYRSIAWRGGPGREARPDGSASAGRAMWESTVGSGVPVIATLERLRAAGDTVRRIEGTFSGTMGFLTNGLREGRAFSDLVREARELHFTEPDPRTDLGGIDMARKALILARGCGWDLELDDVEVEALYPPALDALSVAGFLDALEALDEIMAARVARVADEGSVLRYVATVDPEAGVCRVGPTAVPADSPLGRLRGTDNLVTFHSRWYDPEPLVLQGRGAGVDATAAGVLADVVQLAGLLV